MEMYGHLAKQSKAKCRKLVSESLIVEINEQYILFVKNNDNCAMIDSHDAAKQGRTLNDATLKQINVNTYATTCPETAFP